MKPRLRFRRGGGLALVGLALLAGEMAETARSAPASFEALKLAAKKDEAAQYQVGLACLYGVGTDRNEKEAFSWLKKSADKGYAPAEYLVGYCYSAELGTKASEPSAFKYYLSAAQHGIVDAQFKAGYCYEMGQGVKANPAEAAAWYQKAAEAGLAQAQYKLGNLYSTGTGVNPDYNIAAAWYMKAAKQGLREAQLGLAVCYTVQRDDVEAYEWLILAAQLGYQKAVDQLDKKSFFKADVKQKAAEHARKTAAEIAARQKEAAGSK